MRGVAGGLLMAVALNVVAGTLPAATPATGHYVVFELDERGAPQPVFHASVPMVGIASAPLLSTLFPLPHGQEHGHVAGHGPAIRLSVYDHVGAKSGPTQTWTLPTHVRGEFPDAFGDGALQPVQAPLDRPAFVLRLAQTAGTQVELAVGVHRQRFDLDALARDAAELPLAAAAQQRPGPAKAAGTGPAANRVDILVLGDGYAEGEQEAFARHADLLEQSLLAVSPHKEYAAFVQFSRAFVPSAQSGADHPPYQAGCTQTSCCADPAAQGDPRAGQFVNTAFDARFCTAQSQRLLTINHSKVLAAASAYPDWDLVFVTVNDPVYGGSGGSISVSSAHEQAPKLVVHEFGHSFSGLADEYETPYPGFPACSDSGALPARCEANVSDVGVAGQVKWSLIPGTGLFEGARYQAVGMYRPVNNCLMRSLSAALCPVCRQEYVLTLYRGGFGVPAAGIDLIEPGSESPSPATTVRYRTGSSQRFRADLLRPTAQAPLTVEWWLDGQRVASGAAEFDFQQAAAEPATRQLELRVTDPAPLVHSAEAKPLLTHSRRWTIQVEAATPTFTPDNGWYWNPDEGGRGYFFERKPGGGVFLAGFLYADDGRSTWFTAQGTMAAGQTTFLAPMHSFRGGQTLTGPYRAPERSADLGQLALVFSDPRHARLTMPGTDIGLERFPIASGSVVAPPQAGAPQSGWYWNPQDGGRGYAIEFQGDQVFVIAFLYDDAGAPIWVLANGSMSTPTRYAGRWLRFAGGQALGQTPRPPQPLTPDAGALLIEFPTPDRGDLTLPDGRVIGIERFPF